MKILSYHSNVSTFVREIDAIICIIDFFLIFNEDGINVSHSIWYVTQFVNSQ